MDLIAILIVTPISDLLPRHRPHIFTAAVLIQITGLLLTTFAPPSHPWTRYGGLLLVGFGLGPTVPVTMTWTSEIFQRRHGEVGVAAASALVSGLGNLGSITTTYALYSGWPADAAPGPHRFRGSNLAMIGILVASIVAAGVMVVLLAWFGNEPVKVVSSGSSGVTERAEEARFVDGAAMREGKRGSVGGGWWRSREAVAY